MLEKTTRSATVDLRCWRGRTPTSPPVTAKLLSLILLLLVSCSHDRVARRPVDTAPFTVVLGIAQDGGYPQAGCNRDDCVSAWNDPRRRRHVASLAIVDPQSHERWLIDATPDFPQQLRTLDQIHPVAGIPGLSGVFVTHAHIGHYTGLMYLGREVLGARGIPVYVMPRLKIFLEKNGPWDQLVGLGNIELRPLGDGTPIRLNERIEIVPISVPHRDEYSETVGFIIKGPSRSILFLPDIDKWEKWSERIEDVLAKVDVAYVDGTFHDASELPGRSMSEIPHPFMIETMERLSPMPLSLRSKIRFIHLNQSNPALRDPAIATTIRSKGFNLAAEQEREGL